MSTPATDRAELAPGPLPEIPDPPRRGAVRSLQRALLSRPTDLDERGLSEHAAEQIAYSVADPAVTRNFSLRHPSYLRVPGGTLTTITDRVLVNRVITYPVNPRVLESQPFPAGQPSSAADRLFWPERDLVEDPELHAGLLLRADTRLQVSGVLQAHGTALRQLNKLDTIPQLGVLQPIILIPMTVNTLGENSPPVTVLTSVEGSSRTAWSHFTQGLNPSDPIYGATADPAAAQIVARQLAAVRTAPANAVTPEELSRARTLLIPAQIIIGFTPAEGRQDASLTAAIDQLLGLTHIDPPKPWSQQAAESTIGEKILASLRAAGSINVDEQAWLAGMLSPGDAKTKGLDPWLARRAAQLLWFVSRDPKDHVGQAVAEGVRSASFQRRASRQAKSDAAAALALRALPSANATGQRSIRAALPRAMRMPAFHVSGSQGDGNWQVTQRSPDDLRDRAIEELERGERGSAALELCALAAWALVTHGALGRGTAKDRRDGDPRDPEQILAALTETELGIRVMHRAVLDDRDGVTPRAIDVKTWQTVPTADAGWLVANESWLRATVVPRENSAAPGAATGATATATNTQATLTPSRLLDRKLDELETRAVQTGTLVGELRTIFEDDGTAVVDREGVEDERAERIAKPLMSAFAEIKAHQMTFNRRYGSEPEDDDDPDEGAAD